MFITETYELLIKISGSTSKYCKRPVPQKFLVPGILAHFRQFIQQLGDDESVVTMKNRVMEEKFNQDSSYSVRAFD
jgi:hypothetical protein